MTHCERVELAHRGRPGGHGLPPGLGLVEPGPSRPYMLKQARLWRRDLGANVDLMIDETERSRRWNC